MAGLLGILAVGQLRGQAGVPGLAGLSAQELTLLIANLNANNEVLRTEVAELSRQEERLAAANAGGTTTVGQLRSDLARIRAWSGLTAVSGQGVTITIQGAIGGDGVEDLLNELRNAGAEALAVGGVRVVPGVVVAGAPGVLSLENTPLGEAFEIRAIGSPEILTGTLTRLGGVVAQIATTYPDAVLTVTPTNLVAVPASGRSLAPAYARPRL
ncbi:MAG TPA: DUF881 domain-containing protein [Candidatus Deferrimicrobiaceae bacterium]|nr:DUF881 domain-containing protein [Candidatus Deferrimicrobiaceae bacterium]